jgi:hypothetical protein
MLLPIVQTWQQYLRDGRVRMTTSFHAIRAVLTAEQWSVIRAMHLSTRDIELWIGSTLDLNPCRCGVWAATGRMPPPEPPPSAPYSRLLFLFRQEQIGVLRFADRVISLLQQWAAEGP